MFHVAQATAVSCFRPAKGKCGRVSRATLEKTLGQELLRTRPLLLTHSPLPQCNTFQRWTASTATNGVAELNFQDPQSAFKSKNLAELFRSWMILKICTIKPIVGNCEAIYTLVAKIPIAKSVMHWGMRKTFFSHFCAGEDGKDIAPRIESLRKIGIGSILDYAAEAEVGADASEKPPEAKASESNMVYKSEADADANAAIFEVAVQAVRDTSPEGFAAIKISALGDTKLLERISIVLTQIREFYRNMLATSLQEEASANKLTYEQFKKGWMYFFTFDDAETRAIFDKMDSDKDGLVDYMEFTYSLTPATINELLVKCNTKGPLSQAALTDQELVLLANMHRRVHGISNLASTLGVRIMLDAEWMAIQPAIDHITLNMQREFNKKYAVIFNTYQTYLRRSPHRVDMDIARSEREGWAFAAKIVRGAYMVSERARAEQMGITSPVWDSFEETTANFNNVVSKVLTHVQQTGMQETTLKAEVMFGTHNRDSIELIVGSMKDLGIPPNSGVHFGQLLGMADHITMPLGSHGYKAYKYVPYGPLGEVMPYLIRRTQENSTFLGSPQVAEERLLVWSELRRRIFG